MHEHQNMEILKEFGLDVPRGEVAETVEEARAITDRFGESLTAYIRMCELGWSRTALPDAMDLSSVVGSHTTGTQLGVLYREVSLMQS